MVFTWGLVHDMGNIPHFYALCYAGLPPNDFNDSSRLEPPNFAMALLYLAERKASYDRACGRLGASCQDAVRMLR